MYNYSFIIPHKNCPDLLQRCVDSIPERDDVQVIVVDDNSDEGKKPSLKERKNMQVILLEATQSKGAGRARNIGLKHASGNWLLFPDSDDYYVDGFMSVLDKYIAKDIEVIYFNYLFKDGNNDEELPKLGYRRCFDEYDGSKEALDKVKYRIKAPWTKMVSHTYINKHHISFEEVPNGNDILFTLCVGFYAQKTVVIKDPLYVYLRNKNSILTSKETVSGAFCRLKHLIKLNYFYAFIDHPEWKCSVKRRILSKIISLKIPFVAVLIKNSYRLYKERREWVKMFSA